MSKQKKEVQTALIKPTNIPEGLAAVTEKLKGLEEIQTSKFKTGDTKMAGFNNPVNKETDSGTLVKMLSNVSLREDYYNKSADKLSDVQPTLPVFKLEGYPAQDWEDDIRLQLKIVSTKERYDKLKKVEETLRGLMKDEDKFAMAMADLESI